MVYSKNILSLGLIQELYTARHALAHLIELTALQVGSARFESFQPHHGPEVDKASNRNEYQEYHMGG
jgi:hypothetical protein